MTTSERCEVAGKPVEHLDLVKRIERDRLASHRCPGCGRQIGTRFDPRTGTFCGIPCHRRVAETAEEVRARRRVEWKMRRPTEREVNRG